MPPRARRGKPSPRPPLRLIDPPEPEVLVKLKEMFPDLSAAKFKEYINADQPVDHPEVFAREAEVQSCTDLAEDISTECRLLQVFVVLSVLGTGFVTWTIYYQGNYLDLQPAVFKHIRGVNCLVPVRTEKKRDELYCWGCIPSLLLWYMLLRIYKSARACHADYLSSLIGDDDSFVKFDLRWMKAAIYFVILCSVSHEIWLYLSYKKILRFYDFSSYSLALSDILDVSVFIVVIYYRSAVIYRPRFQVGEYIANRLDVSDSTWIRKLQAARRMEALMYLVLILLKIRPNFVTIAVLAYYNIPKRPGCFKRTMLKHLKDFFTMISNPYVHEDDYDDDEDQQQGDEQGGLDDEEVHHHDDQHNRGGGGPRGGRGGRRHQQARPLQHVEDDTVISLFPKLTSETLNKNIQRDERLARVYQKLTTLVKQRQLEHRGTLVFVTINIVSLIILSTFKIFVDPFPVEMTWPETLAPSWNKSKEVLEYVGKYLPIYAVYDHINNWTGYIVLDFLLLILRKFTLQRFYYANSNTYKHCPRKTYFYTWSLAIFIFIIRVLVILFLAAVCIPKAVQLFHFLNLQLDDCLGKQLAQYLNIQLAHYEITPRKIKLYFHLYLYEVGAYPLVITHRLAVTMHRYCTGVHYGNQFHVESKRFFWETLFWEGWMSFSFFLYLNSLPILIIFAMFPEVCKIAVIMRNWLVKCCPCKGVFKIWL